MDTHQRVGDSLLSLYRAGKLTPSAVKQTMAEASRELDLKRDADRIRGLIRRLKYVGVIMSDEKLLEEYWKLMRPIDVQEGGSGI